MFSVSVVIPTIGHAGLRGAVESALAQTYDVVEVLVVADTLVELSVPKNDRVRILRVGPGAGGNVARQVGILCAKGDLIALLDDDDEWLPQRLELQVEAISQSEVSIADPWIATSQVIRVAGETESVLPTRPLQTGEDLHHYLFVKRSPLSDHGFLQASTMLFPRNLAIEVPFDPALKFHQDIGWLLDVLRCFPEVVILQVWKPLVKYYSLPGSVSKRIGPLESVEWARGRLTHVSSRVLGDFILTQSLGFARRSGPRGMAKVLWYGIRYGRPGIAAVVYASLVTTKAAFVATFRAPRRKERAHGSN